MKKSKPSRQPKTKKAPAAKKTPPKVKKTPVVKKTTPKTKKTSVRKKIAKKPVSKKAPRQKRPKKFDPIPTQKDFGFPNQTPELPQTYGEDQLVLMSKEPNQFFSYWEITPQLLAIKSAEKNPGELYREVMKLNWPARSLFDLNFALLPVSFDSRKWYVNAPIQGLPYHVELGWLGDHGHFISLMTSNAAETAESWESALKRLQNANDVLAYSVRLTQHLGASDSLHSGKR